MSFSYWRCMIKIRVTSYLIIKFDQINFMNFEIRILNYNFIFILIVSFMYKRTSFCNIKNDNISIKLEEMRK